MSKAVLVIDMPESCMGCPVEQGDYCDPYCGADAKSRDVFFRERPDWCPLVPLPEKKETHTSIECHTNGSWTDGMKSGWNACIDAITGNSQP